MSVTVGLFQFYVLLLLFCNFYLSLLIDSLIGIKMTKKSKKFQKMLSKKKKKNTGPPKKKKKKEKKERRKGKERRRTEKEFWS